MNSGNDKTRKRMGRGRFLGFLGKIGILSLLPALPLYAEEKVEARRFTGLRQTGAMKISRSPMIKGRMLSDEALSAKLSTKNLENIRDMMTGRFFGKIAESAFKDGYVPLIKWGLGGEGSENGCFFYAKIGPKGPGPEELSNCSMFINARKNAGMLFLDIYSISASAPGPIDLGTECALVLDCPGYCDKCGMYCSGTFCNPKSALDLYEIVSYPADRFASELKDILQTSDVDKLQQEIRNVVFSDESLNMGLQHFVDAAYEGMAGEAALL
jgi:hypothetical protein